MPKEGRTIWDSSIGTTRVRILQLADDDCIVEELLVPIESMGKVPEHKLSYIREDAEGLWCACSDNLASEAYMRAFLETRVKLQALEVKP
jgi:hypothetical protein